jgi:hypothetical protein
MNRNEQATLAKQLAALSARLAANGNRGADWNAARNLEDAIGSGFATDEQVARAETLLARYRRK